MVCQRLVSCLGVMLMLSPSLAGQSSGRLSLPTIMQGPKYSGYAPSGVRWSGDGQRVYFQWKRHTDAIRAPFDTYVVNRDGSGLRKLSEEEARLAPPEDCDRDEKHTRCVYAQGGDVWLYDFTRDQARRLTATTDVEGQPRFLPDGAAVAYQRGGNLYAQTLGEAGIEQLTDFRTGKPGPDEEEPKRDAKKELSAQEFLKQEEKELLATIKERAALREQARERRRRENPRKPYYLQPRNSAGAMQVTGDRKYVVATLVERPEGAKETLVPNYVTESAYTENLTARTNVGDLQGKSRLVVVNVATGEVKNVELPLGEKPKPVNVVNVTLSDDGRRAVFLARSTDNKDLWRFALDAAEGKARLLAHDHDDAWIGGPGVTRLLFSADGETVYFQSERTGYSHLYAVAFGGGEARALTSGNYEVTGVEWARDKKRMYLTTSQGSPFERHFYAFDPVTRAETKLTTKPGEHSVTLSPDEKWMAEVYSYTNVPDEVYVSEAKTGAAMRRLTVSPSPEFQARAWMDVPIVEIPARDGKKVPGRFYKPANWRRGGPAVLFVHGAGYLQNVHRWWSNYSREYMFHHLLVENGYAVLDIDYRASAGYGRDWRTGIYRFMGGKDLEDHVDAAKWLVSEQGVDAKRIGIYGGSYGGFITLMGMFTTPGVFAAGAALRPVTDWAHYNHPYTSNILNEPHKDTEAYRKSSPIYHAQGLQGALLICHGMVDVNVHYQDSVRLAQRLIELGKENWELASYPVEDHGFVEPSSWTDEYSRIFKLFERHLK